MGILELIANRPIFNLRSLVYVCNPSSNTEELLPCYLHYCTAKFSLLMNREICHWRGLHHTWEGLLSRRSLDLLHKSLKPLPNPPLKGEGVRFIPPVSGGLRGVNSTASKRSIAHRSLQWTMSNFPIKFSAFLPFLYEEWDSNAPRFNIWCFPNSECDRRQKYLYRS